MAFNLTVSTITPPDGLQHTDRKTEIMELPTYLRVTGAAGSSSLKLIYVGTTAPGPENIDNVWLKTDELGTAHGFYLYDTSLGTWMLMGGPGIVSGATAPTDTNVLWLKTDSVDAVLTPGGTAVTAPQGLYKFNGTLWVCATTTAAAAQEVYVQATAPTGATNVAWIKTAAEKGVWYWDGAAWVNSSAVAAIGSGVGSSYIQTGSVAPIAAIRPYTLWAKTGNPPVGLFWPDVANSRWESINPILISLLYPATGTVPFVTGYFESADLPYSIICPTIGSAVFATEPMIALTRETDSLFATDGASFAWGAIPSLATFKIGGYNGGSGTRNIAFRVSATGIMRIPF